MKSGYTLYIDESGVGDLRHMGEFFVMSTMLIHDIDFEIIQGYLRLLKRKFLKDDLINLHATDLFERTYMKYRRLKKPNDRFYAFIIELMSLVKVIPYRVGVYYVNKNKMRSSNLNYQNNPLMPYEKTSLQAFFDFSNFLKLNKTYGKIVIESRFRHDGEFVGYFDKARTTRINGILNPSATTVKERINTIEICNKNLVDGGIELADLCAYACMRKLGGDPQRKLNRTSMGHLLGIANFFTTNHYTSMRQVEVR